MELKCGGRRRYGGIFTLGPIRWEDCKEEPIVILTVKHSDGTKEKCPACKQCWKECIENKIKILSSVPI